MSLLLLLLFVTDIPDTYSKHYVAPFIHEITSMKLCRLFAQREGKGNGREANDKEKPNKDEIEVGVWNSDPNKKGLFFLSFNLQCITDKLKIIKVRKSNPTKPLLFRKGYVEGIFPIPAFNPNMAKTPSDSTPSIRALSFHPSPPSPTLSNPAPLPHPTGQQEISKN